MGISTDSFRYDPFVVEVSPANGVWHWSVRWPGVIPKAEPGVEDTILTGTALGPNMALILAERALLDYIAATFDALTAARDAILTN